MKKSIRENFDLLRLNGLRMKRIIACVLALTMLLLTACTNFGNDVTTDSGDGTGHSGETTKKIQKSRLTL